MKSHLNRDTSDIGSLCVAHRDPQLLLWYLVFRLINLTLKQLRIVEHFFENRSNLSRFPLSRLLQRKVPRRV